jgi:serine/threonine-protein kinase
MPRCPSCGHLHRPGEPCTASRWAGDGTGTLALDAVPAAKGPPAQDPLVGQVVGSFRVVRPLGRGGMGTVYLAEHPVIGSRVAIKFLHESMASNPELVARFYDEARAVNRIGHENIVGIFDLSVVPPNRYFIVMEYLEGEVLSSLLRKGPVPLEESLAILGQLCDALQCAHEHGVVHRDLKPDNVFVLRRKGAPFVKLLDFGIAKLRDAPAGSHTLAGMIVGTPEYMAPEQCDNRNVDARTDVYALGVMAYQLLSGSLPFTGSIAQLLVAQLSEEPRPPSLLNPSLPPGTDAVLLRALRKRPEDRHPDMAALGAALAALRAEPASRAAAQPASQPERRSAPRTAPGHARIRVRLAGDTTPRELPASDFSRAGVYVESAPPLPAPFSRAGVVLPGDPPVEVAAEVVRVVTPADAAAWGMASGFALQFHPASPTERTALEAAAGPGRPTPRGTTGGEEAGAFLEQLEARAGGSHYEFLGVPPDVELKDVQSRARSLGVQLEQLRSRRLSARHAALVAPLLARVARAAEVLGVASERIDHDARTGNHLGVARCIAAGLPDAVLAKRRADLLRERPGAAEKAAACFSRARVARAMGNVAVARAQLEEALSLDPLNLDIQKEYWALRRG